jgi:transcriptional regulator with XRE-family HTH domain
MGRRADQGGWSSTGFGARLAAARQVAGISQRELGDRCGVHPNTLAKLERGEQEPAWPLVLALADALGVSTEAFRPLAAGAGTGEADTPGAAATSPAVEPSASPAAAAAAPKRGRPQKPAAGEGKGRAKKGKS